MEVTYENIKNLIVSEEVDGMMIKLQFQAPGQPTPLDAIAVVAPDQDEIMKNAMKAAAVTGAAGAGIGMATSALGSALGSVGSQVAGAAGSVATGAIAANQMNPEKLMKTDMDGEKREAAIVQAFAPYLTYYKWENDQWVYNTPG